jgi:ABC-type sugar transport system ATPase subunit
MGAEPDSSDHSTDGPGAQRNESILGIEDISKHYEGVEALSNVSLDVYDNEVLAIVGDNGAGKSTLIKTIAGVIKPTSGQIYIRTENGLEPRSLDDPNDAKDAGIETVFQDLQLSKKHDVAKNVFLGREPIVEGLKGSVLRKIDRERMDRESIEALAEIGFSVDPKAKTAELSGGQQQAVAVARALISDPNVVLLDEPTAEVSVEGSEKILDLIERLQEQDRTVIFISHNLEEIFQVADRIAVLRDGTLIDVLENDGTVDREHIVGLMTGAI